MKLLPLERFRYVLETIPFLLPLSLVQLLFNFSFIVQDSLYDQGRGWATAHVECGDDTLNLIQLCITELLHKRQEVFFPTLQCFRNKGELSSIRKERVQVPVPRSGSGLLILGEVWYQRSANGWNYWGSSGIPFWVLVCM